ncbi:MAG: carbohydrate-binding family 9-like protein [Myxococcaceae bacterium]
MDTRTRPGRPWLRVALLLVCVAGCRDEQAGPRHKPAAMAPPSSLRTLDAPPAALTFRSGATFAGGAIAYLGSNVTPPNARPGQTATLSHYFVALREPPQGFQFFVHIIDAASGQMVVNADHELQGGAAPLGAWPLGKVIEDIHAVKLPEYPGKLRVGLGFWQGDNRLGVDSPQAHDGQHQMLGPVFGAEEPKLREYEAVRADKPPAMDGTLDDPAWQKALAAELVGSFDGRPSSLRTSVRMLWDDQNLYVGFECEDPDAWGSLLKHDDPIYNEEAVEVFLDANGDGKSYNELQVSPNNVTFDAAFAARRSDLATAMAWESGVKTAVKVRGKVNDPADRDEGWSAEMVIPIASLLEVPSAPPKSGDRWRFNAYRLEHLQRKQVEGSAFSPLFVGDFHHLPRFGWLVFK